MEKQDTIFEALVKNLSKYSILILFCVLGLKASYPSLLYSLVKFLFRMPFLAKNQNTMKQVILFTQEAALASELSNGSVA